MEKIGKSHNAEELTRQQVKQFIKNKFGNASRFCRLTGRDINQYHKLFALKDSEVTQAKLRAVYDDAVKTEDKKTQGELTEKNRREIKSGIFAVANNITEFSEKFKFRNTWISAVLGGSVQKITPRVRQLAKAAGVKL